MKGTSIVVVLLSALAVAACGTVSVSGDVTPGPTTSSPTTNPNPNPPNPNPPNPNPPNPNPPNPNASYTVSGQIVHQDTGAPYPNAYVRFEWLLNANEAQEAHTLTDASGRYAIQLPAGQYQVTAGDSCDLNAGFAIVGRAPDDVEITVPGTGEVDFVEQPITPGADIPGVC